MVLGDPYNFSIILEVVEEWNRDNTFCNGVLIFCLNGEIFPQKHELVNATLRSEIPNLIRQFTQIAVNEKLFNMKKEDAFSEIYDITYPRDEELDNDYSYYLTPYCFEDVHCRIFAVSNGQQVRILASSNLKYIVEEGRHMINNIKIVEAYISTGDLAKYVKQLEVFGNII